MKQLLLVALMLGGCAALQRPLPKPVEVLAPIEVESTEVEVSQPVTPVEVVTPVANVTRYVLESPLAYSKHIPRAEKFFQLALTDLTVLNKSKFDFSDATPESIRENIRRGLKVKVTTYTPSIWKGGKWSKAIGYHSAGTIYLNNYYVNRKDCEILNTIVHEYSHTMGYSHGDNSSVGKDNSVPYWIGDRAEELCLEGKI